MPRLYHTKSRLGCSRCKARRVKCDEGRPKCGSCVRHEVDCVYERAGNQGLESFFTEGRDRRQREMRLFHVFIAKVCKTIPGTGLPALLDTWTVQVPELAMSYNPLLNAVLAFSCHYQAVTQRHGPAAALQFMEWRGRYLEKLLPEHRVALGDLNQENADSICFTTVLLNLDALAMLRERPLVPFEPPLEWLKLTRGIGDITKLAMDLLKHVTDSLIWPLVESVIPIIRDLRLIDPAGLDGLTHLVDSHPDEIMSADDQETYHETLRLLGWISSARSTQEPVTLYCRRLSAFTTMLPGHFSTLLGERRPRALVMLAYFFALMSYAREMWWVGKTPKREVAAIRDYLAGSKWEDMLVWPIQVVMAEDEPMAIDS